MKEISIDRIFAMKETCNEISKLISQNKLEQALNELQMTNESEKTEKYYELLSTVFIKTKQPSQAVACLKIGQQQFLNSKTLYYKLYEAFWSLGDYEEATFSLARVVRISFDEEERLKETEKLKKIIPQLYRLLGDDKTKQIIAEATLIMGEGDERAFPIDKDAKSWVNRTLIDSKGKKYLVNIYKGYMANDLNLNVRYFLKTEIIQGTNHRYAKLKLNKRSILPISSDLNEASIEITKTGGEPSIINASNMQSNRLNYLQLDVGEYKLKSKQEFFVGKPIQNEFTEKNKLVIVLYIDGLSQRFLEEYGLDALMPNTAQYFKEGYWNKNCYTTSDWTFPSVASIFTGQSVIRHKVYHPNTNIDIHKRGEMYTGKFKVHGLFTTQINNNWRITPSSGYMEDFDRIIFQHFRGGFAIAEVLGEAIEHLSSLPNNDHFLWLGIEDLHDIADGFNQDLYQQTHLTLEERLMNEMAEVSVNAEYSADKLIKYKNQLNRIDLYLESFYHYLNKNHEKDDVYISIISDHGQGYIENNEEFLNEGRRKVPFLFKGPNVPNKISDELMAITDYFPNMLTAIGANAELTHENDAVILKDFGGTGRDMAITETIHPDNPYRIAITDGNSIFRLHTVEKAEKDGLIHLEKVKVELVDKETEQNIMNKYPEKVEAYIEFVINRVKHFQYI
ncbi:sulfatase-like hydrolase/transferase [Solibacillus daqui]|uniref:sulfatase-like hydrolase/transferase n=1 Tax=Solibacillus daqui TaxID=2912187 RepID=UPI002365A43A|nr:sulfatase-like hydrolase/transferase [Solibacillus daqui]